MLAASLFSKFFARDTNGQIDPFTVLGVSRSASSQEIHQAWRRLAQEYHPDRMMSLPDTVSLSAGSRLAEINQAYDAISRRRKPK